MPPDPHHCFSCDRRLDDPPGSHIVRRCPDCQADMDAHLAALGDLEAAPRPRFRGTIALDQSLPGWPTDLTLLSLAVWDRLAELHVVQEPDPDFRAHPRAVTFGDRDLQPHKWVLGTDAGTVHHGGGGGGGSQATGFLHSHTTIAPSLPDGAMQLHIQAQAPGATSTTSVDLSTRRLTRRVAVVEHLDPPSDTDPDCPSCGPPAPPSPPAKPPPGPHLDRAMPEPPDAATEPFIRRDPRPLCVTCRDNREAVVAAKAPTGPRPDRVIAVGAGLGRLFGTDLSVTSVVAWPPWFDLTLVGHNTGAWAESMIGFNRATRWSAHDDLGQRYRGTWVGGHGGHGFTTRHLTFVPALAPDATTLTLDFPLSIDGTCPRATLDLTPEPP